MWATTNEQSYGCSPWSPRICSRDAVPVLIVFIMALNIPFHGLSWSRNWYQFFFWLRVWETLDLSTMHLVSQLSWDLKSEIISSHMRMRVLRLVHWPCARKCIVHFELLNLCASRQLMNFYGLKISLNLGMSHGHLKKLFFSYFFRHSL